MDWVNDFANTASDALTEVGNYLNENEWAANALAGAAAGGAAYLAQKDQQKFDRRQTDKAWERKLSLAKAPNMDMNKYQWSDLSSGSMTNGGLIAGGMNK